MSRSASAAALDDHPRSLAHLMLVVSDAAHETYGNRKSAVKEMAADAGTTPHTAKNWWKQKNLPDLVNSANLARASAPMATALVGQMVSRGNVFAVLGEIHRLAQMEAEHDPRFAIEYGAFMQRQLLENGR